MSKLDRTDSLILYFLKRRGKPIATTELLKSIYLADYYSRQWLGKPMSDLDWVFYTYGPFDSDFYHHLDHCAEVVEKNPTRTGAGKHCVLYRLKKDTPQPSFNDDETMLLESVADMTAKMSLNQLLEFVYATEPMKELQKKKVDRDEMVPLNMESMNNVARRITGVDLSYLRESQKQLDAGHFRELP